MTLRTPAYAFILSLVAFPACGSDSNGDGSGTGGVGGIGGESGSGGTDVGGTGSGTGGSVSGTGGSVTGAGGSLTGSGGSLTGSGGSLTGSGGSLTGSGGSSAGGAAGASGAAGMAGVAGAGGSAGGAGAGGTAGASGASGSGGVSDAGLDSSTEPDASDASDASDAGMQPDASDASDARVDSAVNCTGATTVDVTKGGTVTASSTSIGANNRYAATRAVDGNVATAWYGGDNRANATFTWTATGDDCISEIDTTNTAGVTARPNWGYESVIVDVLTQAGVSVFTKTISMTGSPDPNLVVDTGGVVGRRVRLSFSGLEPQHITGGIAEMNVKAKR